MARKTLGKMEFSSLIDTLQEQNSAQLEAQQETTKNIRNLHAYFIKQDRAAMRKELEEDLEGGGRANAQKVGKTKMTRTGKSILRKILDFFLTGLMGSAGAGLFKSVVGSVKFGGPFFKTLAGLMGGLILSDGIWDAVKQGMDKGEGFTGKINEIATAFFKKNDFVKTVTGGALLGTMFAGPKGAIAGALLFGGMSLIGKSLGEKETLGDFFTGNVSGYSGALAGAVPGAMAGFWMGSSFGPVGAVAGALLGASFGALAGFFMQKDVQDVAKQHPLKFFLGTVGGAALMGIAGFKLGAAMGMIGGPLGMLVGGMIGAVMGALGAYFFAKKAKELEKAKDWGDEINKLQEQKYDRLLELQKQGLKASEDKELKRIESQIEAAKIMDKDVGAGEVGHQFQKALTEMSPEAQVEAVAMQTKARTLSGSFMKGSDLKNIMTHAKTLKSQIDPTKFPAYGKDITRLADVVKKVGGEWVQVAPLSQREWTKMQALMGMNNITNTNDPRFAQMMEDNEGFIWNRNLKNVLNVLAKQSPTEQQRILTTPAAQFNAGGFVPAGQVTPAILHGPEMVFNRDQMKHLQGMFGMHKQIVASATKTPIIINQSGGMASTPGQVNISNTNMHNENVMRTMPTTSSINMSTALV